MPCSAGESVIKAGRMNTPRASSVLEADDALRRPLRIMLRTAEGDTHLATSLSRQCRMSQTGQVAGRGSLHGMSCDSVHLLALWHRNHDATELATHLKSTLPACCCALSHTWNTTGSLCVSSPGKA